MAKWKFGGLIVALVCVLMLVPVAACDYSKGIQKTGPVKICPNTDFTYSITANVDHGSGTWVTIVDTLPTGVTYKVGSASLPPGIGNTFNYDGINKLTWVIYVNNNAWSQTVTFDATSPASFSYFTNTVKYYDGKVAYLSHLQGQGSYTTNYNELCDDQQQLPEFPTLALPVGMMLGFVFIVYSLRSRKKE